MVDDAPWVLFVVNGERYALPSSAVDRIVQLPGLTALPGAPAYLAGVFDVGGIMVPVLDLSTLLNRPGNRYVLTDSVILLHGGGRPLGIIANQVIDICSISRAEGETILPGFGDKPGRNLIDRVARVENEIVLLLNSGKLLQHGDITGSVPQADDRANERSFYQNIPPGEQEVFRERARGLVRQLGEEDQTGFLELVVVRLSGEYFGLPLECIREFCEIRNITPVPCCPQHIMGTMNLRGEILTVIDICPILRMPSSKAVQKKVVVVDHGGLIAGIGIDDIEDLVYVDRSQIARLPLAADAAASQYLGGTAVYGNHVLTILDAAKLLSSEELVVNDEI